MSEKLQPKALNVGKVAKRKSSPPAPCSKNSLTCAFTKVKMSPNNKLQLFRHLTPSEGAFPSEGEDWMLPEAGLRPAGGICHRRGSIGHCREV